MRRRPRKIQPTSISALDAKARYATLVRSWRDLDIEDRLAWTRSALTTPFPNRLGTARLLSGYQLFVWVHLAQPVENATPLTEPPQMIRVPSPFTLTLDLTWPGPFTYAATSAAFAGTIHYKTQFSRPLSSSEIAPARIWVTSPFQSTPPSTSLTVAAGVTVGLPGVGELLHVRLIPFSNGYLPGFPIEAKAIVHA